MNTPPKDIEEILDTWGDDSNVALGAAAQTTIVGGLLPIGAGVLTNTTTTHNPYIIPAKPKAPTNAARIGKTVSLSLTEFDQLVKRCHSALDTPKSIMGQVIIVPPLGWGVRVTTPLRREFGFDRGVKVALSEMTFEHPGDGRELHVGVGAVMEVDFVNARSHTKTYFTTWGASEGWYESLEDLQMALLALAAEV